MNTANGDFPPISKMKSSTSSLLREFVFIVVGFSQSLKITVNLSFFN